jgi:hypothetical protein
MVPLLGVVCAACGGNSGDIAGSWLDSSQNIAVQFRPDGTYTQSTQKGRAKISINGTYTLSGNHLVMTFKDASFENVPVPNQDEFRTTMKNRPPDEADVQFVNKDEINVKRGMTTEMMTRG